MNSTRVSSLSLTVLCRLVGCFLAVTSLFLIGCGGATGLEGGHSQGVSGSAGVGADEAGQAGVSDVGGASGTGAGGSTAGNAGTSSGEAGEAGATAQLISLQVTPVSATAAVGTQVALRATGTYSDQSRKDVTASATWSSGTPATATVDAGLVSAVAPGSTTISATLDGQRSSAAITVPTAKVQSLAVTPTTASIGIQGTQAFQAVVTLSDGTTQDVTATATWASTKPAVATIASGGLATGVSAGTTTISAAAAGFTADSALTVSTATLGSGASDCQGSFVSTPALRSATAPANACLDATAARIHPDLSVSSGGGGK